MKYRDDYEYMALMTREADGGYSVRFPQLDGCFTCGDDMDDARRMAAEALCLYLYTLEQDGEEIPDPDLDVISHTQPGELAVPITAWMAPFRDEMANRSVKKTLTIPAWLNDAAEKRGVNYSQLLQSALKKYLGIYQS